MSARLYPQLARGLRESPGGKAKVSPSARAKAAAKRTPDGLPAQSFRTLLDHLAAQTLSAVTLPGNPKAVFPLQAEPTPLQARSFELLAVAPGKFVPEAVPVK